MLCCAVLCFVFFFFRLTARRYAGKDTSARLHTSLLVRKVSVDKPSIPTPAYSPALNVARGGKLHSWDYNPFVEVGGTVLCGWCGCVDVRAWVCGCVCYARVCVGWGN